jgi:hypothetical protein
MLTCALQAVLRSQRGDRRIEKHDASDDEASTYSESGRNRRVHLARASLAAREPRSSRASACTEAKRAGAFASLSPEASWSVHYIVKQTT